MTGAGGEFMKKTRLPALEPSDQACGRPQPPLELTLSSAAARIDLPRPESLDLGRVPLSSVIESRRSLRVYDDSPLSLAELSFLLWATQGIRDVRPGEATLRTVPSAGARHPFETALSVNRVRGLDPGLYHYVATRHCLLRLPGGAETSAQIAQAALGQEMVAKSAVTFIWIVASERTTWRYGERGYRYLHLDAGHVAQNLYLAAESLGAGACAIAAFSDDAMNELLGLDGERHFAIYLAAVGKKPRQQAA